jgi:hypothetical protein
MATNFGDHVGWDDGGWDEVRPRLPGTVALRRTVAFRDTVAVPDTIADIAERLMGEFGGRLDLAVISAAVLDSVHHLECAGAPSPEHIERLARHRLRMATHRTGRDGERAPGIASPPAATAAPTGA